MRVLVIEDSEILRQSLGRGLRKSGFVVDLVADGEQGWIHASCNEYEVVVLDLGLPDGDGLDLLRRLRRDGHDCHVLILTARDALDDRLIGLRAGADDYLVKPFAFDELVARIEALGRRRSQSKSPVLAFGDLTLSAASRELRWKDTVIPTTRREFNLIRYLCLRKREVVTRYEIEDQLYDEHSLPESNSVSSAIYSLRRKLQDAGCPPMIETRRGVGYVFVPADDDD